MSIRKPRHLAAALAAVALAAVATSALVPRAGAQERLTNFSGRDVTTRELIDALRGPAPVGRRSRTRGINLAPMLAAAEAAASEQATAKASLDQIYFEFDSSRLTPQAIDILTRVGAALAASELASRAFIVEGHTDAQGTDAYNQSLSVRRAEAVRDHLIEHHGILAARLKALGKGESELLDPANPNGPANRRVVFASVASDAH